MAIPPFIAGRKPEFQKAIDHFKEELGALRSGRANPAMLENVMVDAYGSTMPLKGVASVSVPDAKTLAIEPWDAGLVKSIEQALIAADLGMMPTVQGKLIRMVMPPMTEERRKQLVKVVKEKAEDARVALRGVRERVRDEVIEMEKEKQIAEDDRYRLQDELDKMTKQFNEIIEQIAVEKEEEIMKV
ncbi:MAG: ribosome recycling factor [bacterium]|nr:ribosome recycling factor [bacterium]